MTPNGKNQAGVSQISFYNSVAPVEAREQRKLIGIDLRGLN
jgi:hypothetical protein